MTDAALRAPLIRNRDYVCLLGAQALSLSGREIEGLVLPLLVLGLTGSPAQVGLVAACQTLPYLLFSLPAGALIDRSGRRRVMMLCEAVRALAFATLPLAWWLGGLAMIQIYLVAAVAGSAFVFHNIAEVSALPLVVDAADLPKASSANGVVEWIGENSGPALGGVLVGVGRSTVAGAMLAYAVQAGMLVASLGFLGAIRSPMRATSQPERRGTLLSEMGEGLRWLWGHPQIRAMALLAMALNLIFSPVSLAMIVLARTSFHAPPAAIGLMFSLAGGAGLTATLLAPWVRQRVRLGVIIVGGVAVWAVGLGLVAASTSMLTLALAWLVMPASSGIQSVAGVSYRLSLIPEAMQGRVNSVFRFMAWGVQPAALAIGGALVGAIGARQTLWLLALGMTLTAAAVASSPLRRAV
ncbi:MAG TPA: MFS transporter [Caulobacteraceae bacterium]